MEPRGGWGSPGACPALWRWHGTGGPHPLGLVQHTDLSCPRPHLEGSTGGQPRSESRSGHVQVLYASLDLTAGLGPHLPCWQSVPLDMADSWSCWCVALLPGLASSQFPSQVLEAYASAKSIIASHTVFLSSWGSGLSQPTARDVPWRVRTVSFSPCLHPLSLIPCLFILCHQHVFSLWFCLQIHVSTGRELLAGVSL